MASVIIPILTETRDALKNVDKFTKDAGKSLTTVEKSFKGINKIAKIAAGAAAAFFAGRAVVRGVNNAIDNAKAYEESLSGLNQQLKLSGNFSKETSRQYEQFASVIQRTTRFGDDAALSTLALAERFGLSGERAKQFTQAAAELAQVTGQSLDSAARQLSQTLTGQAGPLARNIAGIRELTAEQLKSGAAIELLNKQFGGTALAATKTFAGAQDQLAKAQGDLSKNLGFLITQNPLVIGAIQVMADGFARAADFVDANKDAILDFSQAVKDRLVVALKILKGTFDAINFGEIGRSIINISVAFAGLFAVLAAARAVNAGLNVQALANALRFFVGTSGIRKIITSVALITGKFLAKAAAFAAAALAVDLLIRNFGLLGPAINRLTNAHEIRSLENKLKSLTDLAGFMGEEFQVKGFGIIGRNAKTTRAEVEREIDEIKKKIDELSGTRENLIKEFDEQVDLGLFGQIKDGVTGLLDSTKEALNGISDEFANLEIVIPDPKVPGFNAPMSGDPTSPDFVGPPNPADTKTVAKIFGKELGVEASLKKFGGELLRGLQRGEEGAVDFVSALGGAAADFFLPGIGGMVSEFIQFATQDPEVIREQINAFVDALPEVIDAFVEGVPVIVEALVERADDIIVALTEAVVIKLPIALTRAMLVGAQVFIENVVKEVGKAFGFLGQLGKSLERGFNMFINALSGLANIFKDIGRLFRDIGRVFQQLIDAIAGVGKSLDPTRSDGIAGQIIRGDVKGLGRRLGLSTGLTEVPQGFPRDSFGPVGLQSGERVIDSETNGDLKDFLRQARSGGSSQQVVVVLQVGQEELARTLLRLDQDGFRTRA